MKKILKAVVILALLSILAACKHSHDFASTWRNDDSFHWRECECGEKDSNEEHKWNSGQITTEATEIGSGVKVFTCTVCGKQKQETIPAKGHTFSELVAAKSATCEEAGSIAYKTCSTCDKLFDENGNEVSTIVIPALGHKAEIVDAVAPTCEETGLTEGKKCSVCDEILVAQEEVAALGHSPAAAIEENKVDSTCKVAGSYDLVVYCSICNEELNRETKTLELAGHKGGIATETERAICEVCGEEYGDLLTHEHDYEIMFDTNYHWKVCDCGDSTEKRPHRGGEISSANQPVCVVCGQSYGADDCLIVVDGNTDDWSEEVKANTLKGWHKDENGNTRGLEYMAFVDEKYVYVYSRTITATNKAKSIDIVFNVDKNRPSLNLSSTNASTNIVYSYFKENVLLENGLYETISEAVIDKSSYVNSQGNIYLSIWFNGCDDSFAPLSWHEASATTVWVLNHRSPWFLNMSHQKVTETGFDHYHDMNASDDNICGWCQEKIDLEVTVDGDASDWKESVIATGVTSVSPNNIFTTAYTDDEFLYMYIEITYLQTAEPNYITIYSKNSANINGIRINERFDLTFDAGATNLRPYCSGKTICQYNYCDCNNGFAKMAIAKKVSAGGKTIACIEVVIDKVLFVNQNPTDANYGLCRYEIQVGPNLSPNQNVTNWAMMIASYEGLHQHNYQTKFDNYYHWTACSCGLSTAKVAHSGGDSSTGSAICSGCNQEYEVHTHDYDISFDDNYHWGVCSCGEVLEKEAHYGGEVIPSQKAICEICGVEYGDVANYAIELDGNVDDWSEEVKSNTLKGWYKDENGNTRGLEYMAFVDEKYVYIYTKTITATNDAKSLDIVFAKGTERPYVHLGANNASKGILYFYFDENRLLDNGLYETVSEMVIDKSSYVNSLGNVYFAIWFNGCDAAFEPLSWHEEAANTAWVLNHRSPWFQHMSHQKVTEAGFDHYHDLNASASNVCGWCQEKIDLDIDVDGNVEDWNEEVLATGITSSASNNVFTTSYFDEKFVYIYLELTQLSDTAPNFISIYSKFSASENGIRANYQFQLTFDAGYTNVRPYCSGKTICQYNYCDCNNGFAKMALTSSTNESGQTVAYFELVIDKKLFINQNPNDENYGLCRYEIQIGPNYSPNQNVSNWGMMIAGENGLHTHDYISKFDEYYHWTECLCGLRTINEAHYGGEATTTEKAVCVECSQEYGRLIDAEHGNVSFVNIKVYDNDYDGIILRPVFTNPELCENEVFTYELDSEEYCYIEDGRVYYLANGTTRVVARSEHFEEVFYIDSEDCTLKSHADARIQKLINSYQGEETLFIGDSFFEFWEYGTTGIKKFSESFGEYNAMNIGVSGSTTHLWRAMNYKIFTEVKAPKNIVINLGTNNVNLYNETGSEVAANIQALIQDYLEMFPETNIYYLSITRCDGYYADNWDNARTSNEIMAAYCENTDRVYYLDVMELYGDNYANLVSDGLHPNQAGYDLFEQIIKENVIMDKKN